MDIRCEYDEYSLEPNYLFLEIIHKDGEVQPVKVEVSGGSVSENDGQLSVKEMIEIRAILRNEYGINDIDIVKSEC